METEITTMAPLQEPEKTAQEILDTRYQNMPEDPADDPNVCIACM